MERIPLDLAMLLPPQRHEGTTTRSEGLHVSDVVYDLCSTRWPQRYPPKLPPAQRPVEARSPVVTTRMQVGSLLEDLVGDTLMRRVAQYHPDIVLRPGEVEQDGLIGTPDWVLLETPRWFQVPDDQHLPPDEPGPPAVVECKGTWLSTNHDLDGDRFKYWIWQARTYGCMLGVGRVLILPLHLNGNYTYDDRRGGGPQFLPAVEDFSPREQAEHWAMITGHAARMRAKGW